MVRPIARADREAWIEMRADLWPDERGRHAADVDGYFDGTIREPLHVVIAVDETGRALGFAEVNIRSYAEDCETDRVGYLEGWYVVPRARRRGVGRALVDAALDWARAQGCTEFASDALIDNIDSAKAHAALGFVETVQLRCFRKAL
jgi:aminoglycoside 6'-N-acetyltransferase I